MPQSGEPKNKTIGLISPGDMGHVVGGVLTAKGHRVLTVLTGRSDLSRERAARAGMQDVGSLENLVAESEVILSIMPPENALMFARDTVAAMAAVGEMPVFVDCNAISPATTRAIDALLETVGAPFLKIGIIGPPPRPGVETRFYASGPGLKQIEFLDGNGISFRPMGDDIMRAAAIKMCYAGLTKGKMTLHTAVLLAGEMLGVGDELQAELASSQQADWELMTARVPFYACDAGRWAGEMDEISQTFGSVGVTPNLHRGAAEVFRFLDSTPLSAETRETADRSRTLDLTLDIYAQALKQRNAASQGKKGKAGS